jgi:hypothetical protein
MSTYSPFGGGARSYALPPDERNRSLRGTDRRHHRAGQRRRRERLGRVVAGLVRLKLGILNVRQQLASRAQRRDAEILEIVLAQQQQRGVIDFVLDKRVGVRRELEAPEHLLNRAIQSPRSGRVVRRGGWRRRRRRRRQWGGDGTRVMPARGGDRRRHYWQRAAMARESRRRAVATTPQRRQGDWWRRRRRSASCCAHTRTTGKSMCARRCASDWATTAQHAALARALLAPSGTASVARALSAAAGRGAETVRNRHRTNQLARRLFAHRSRLGSVLEKFVASSCAVGAIRVREAVEIKRADHGHAHLLLLGKLVWQMSACVETLRIGTGGEQRRHACSVAEKRSLMQRRPVASTENVDLNAHK